MNIFITYSIYLITGALITVTVGADLYCNGYYLILNLFENEVVTQTINKLLLTGYYLVNIGYIALTLTQIDEVETTTVALEQLAYNIGRILLILSYLHFQNIALLAWLSKRKQILINQFN